MARAFLIRWLLPAVAFAATLAGDALYLATRSPVWWRLAGGALLVGVASGLVALLLQAWRSPPRDVTPASKLQAASGVLAVAGLVNAALALGLRAVAVPDGAYAWLARYLTAASCLLLSVASGLAWRGRKPRRSLRVTVAPEERVRR